MYVHSHRQQKTDRDRLCFFILKYRFSLWDYFKQYQYFLNKLTVIEISKSKLLLCVALRINFVFFLPANKHLWPGQPPTEQREFRRPLGAAGYVTVHAQRLAPAADQIQTNNSFITSRYYSTRHHATTQRLHWDGTLAASILLPSCLPGLLGTLTNEPIVSLYSAPLWGLINAHSRTYNYAKESLDDWQ